MNVGLEEFVSVGAENTVKYQEPTTVFWAPLRKSPSRLEPSPLTPVIISPSKTDKKDIISPKQADPIKKQPLASVLKVSRTDSGTSSSPVVELIKAESKSTPASPTRIELSDRGGADTWDIPSPASIRIDIDKMDFGSVSRQDSAKKERLLSAQEKHPRSMHGRSELTLSGGGSMFLKSSKLKAESPVSPQGYTDSEPVVEVVSLTSRDDPLPKGILRDQRAASAKPLWDLDPREMSFEEKQLWRRQELEEERKSVRFNLEKELDIQFNITDSEEANEEEEEEVEEEEILEREEDWNSEDEDPEEERLIAGIKVSDILNLMDASELDEVSAKEDANLAVLAEDILETQMERQTRLNGDINVSQAKKQVELTAILPKSVELSEDVERRLPEEDANDVMAEDESPDPVLILSPTKETVTTHVEIATETSPNHVSVDETKSHEQEEEFSGNSPSLEDPIVIELERRRKEIGQRMRRKMEIQQIQRRPRERILKLQQVMDEENSNKEEELLRLQQEVRLREVKRLEQEKRELLLKEAQEQNVKQKEQEKLFRLQQEVRQREVKRLEQEERELFLKEAEEQKVEQKEQEELKRKEEEEEMKRQEQRERDKALREMEEQAIREKEEMRRKKEKEEMKRKEQEEKDKVLREMEEQAIKDKEKVEMQRIQQNSEKAIKMFQEHLDKETEEAIQQLKDGHAQQLKELQERLKSDEEMERTRLQGELEERMGQFEQELIGKQQQQEQTIRENMEKSLSELRETLAAERETRAETQRIEFSSRLAEQKEQLEAETKQQLEAFRQELAATNQQQLEAAKSELETEGEAQVAKLHEDMEVRQNTLLQQQQQELEEAEARLQEGLAAKVQQRMEELEAAAFDKVVQQLEVELEAKRLELLEEHRVALELLQAQQAEAREKIRLEYKEEEDVLRKDHIERLEEMRVRLEIERQRARERELHEDERKREAARQEMVENSRVFEKLRCEKRLLEDKYRSLKEKYIRLKTDVKISIERRKRREGGTTTGSETERSTSHNKTARPPDIDRSVVDSPRGRARKRTAENIDGTAANSMVNTTTSSGNSKHQQSSAVSPPPKNLPAQLSPEQQRTPPKPAMQVRIKDDAIPLSPPGVDSDNVSSTSSKPTPKPAKHAESVDSHNNNNNNNGSSNNNRRRRQLFGRLKSASTSRLIHNNITNSNNNNNNDTSAGEDGSMSCSPVENLRRQLKKLEDLEDQFPVATHTDTYLRYPFSDTGQFGSSELEFFRHRIHLERDSVRRAKDFLRVQRNNFQCRQRELKQRQVDGSTTARNMLDQLYQEERELTDMEVSLHRTRSLLGEKIIRLRHLEQSLHRVGDKGDVRGLATEDATLSDLSSHSGSSGFSSTELGTDTPLGRSSLHRGTHYQESTEIIQSLENLNTEIREIWEVLNKQQKEGNVRTTAIPPPPLVYTDMGWPTLTGARGAVPVRASTAVPERVQAYRQLTPNPPYSRSATVEASLVERTRSLRDWLRQARLDSTDLVGPAQPTM